MRSSITTVWIVVILAFVFFLFLEFYKPNLSDYYGKVNSQVFVGDSENQPLIVAFGGKRDGNSWTETTGPKSGTIFCSKVMSNAVKFLPYPSAFGN